MKKALLFFVSVFTIGTLAAEPNPARAFVTGLNTQILNILNGAEEDAAKYQALCTIVGQNADVSKMALESLGKYRRTFPVEQLPAYTAAFQAGLTTLLGRSFKEMIKSEIIIQELVTGTPDEQIVSAIVKTPGRSPIRVQFFLAPNAKTQYRLVDAALSGLRLIPNRKSSFEGILSANSDNPSKAGEELIKLMTESTVPCATVAP